jgi:NAD(P)H dehydrogenase (quinone)
MDFFFEFTFVKTIFVKNILIINGHPDKKSFCCAIAESYKKGADLNGTHCKLIHLIDLKFDPILTFGYRKESELEPDLVMMQKEILYAHHLVFVYPNWWSTYPALLKGFFDRVFVPNFAFKYQKNDLFWDKLLKGKTAHLLVTMDTPAWYYWLINKSAGHNSIKIGILEFSGVKPVKITSFGPIKSSDDAKRKLWLEKVAAIGKNQV